MDHDAQLTKMDPKLKEAYERVMGFDHTIHLASQPTAGEPSVDQSTPTPQPSQPKADRPLDETPPIAPPQPISPPPTPPSQTISAPAEDTPIPIEQPLRRMETIHYDKQPTFKSHPVAHQEKKKQKTSPIIVWLGGALFFIIYAVVWMKILGVSIPFLQ